MAELIEILTETLPSGWHWTPDHYLGGTPEFVIETAKSLSDRYEVIVYYDNQAMQFGNIYFLPRSQYTADNIVIACNEEPPKLGKKNIYWTSKNDQEDKQFLDFDERIVLSRYHQSIFGYNSKIINLACWPEQFKNPVKDPKLCLYSSSPDRGGEFLAKIWPEIEKKTGAKLIITYKEDISEDEMIELYKKANLWLHPGIGVELFCISGYKAQVAGCIPVVVPNMALEETIKFGIKTDLQHYKDEIISLLKDEKRQKDIRKDMSKYKFKSWEDVTNEIEDLWKK